MNSKKNYHGFAHLVILAVFTGGIFLIMWAGSSYVKTSKILYNHFHDNYFCNTCKQSAERLRLNTIEERKAIYEYNKKAYLNRQRHGGK